MMKWLMKSMKMSYGNCAQHLLLNCPSVYCEYQKQINKLFNQGLGADVYIFNHICL